MKTKSVFLSATLALFAATGVFAKGDGPKERGEPKKKDPEQVQTVTIPGKLIGTEADSTGTTCAAYCSGTEGVCLTIITVNAIKYIKLADGTIKLVSSNFKVLASQSNVPAN